MDDFIQLNHGELVRWVRIDQIACIEELDDCTVVYLIGLPGVHVETDKTPGDIMNTIQEAWAVAEELAAMAS